MILKCSLEALRNLLNNNVINKKIAIRCGIIEILLYSLPLFWEDAEFLEIAFAVVWVVSIKYEAAKAMIFKKGLVKYLIKALKDRSSLICKTACGAIGVLCEKSKLRVRIILPFFFFFRFNSNKIRKKKS